MNPHGAMRLVLLGAGRQSVHLKDSYACLASLGKFALLLHKEREYAAGTPELEEAEVFSHACRVQITRVPLQPHAPARLEYGVFLKLFTCMSASKSSQFLLSP
eukprot:6456736-Amphidinium_carterae.1